MDRIDRFLAVVQRELDADDARLELGGRDPSAEAVWVDLGDGWRVVALFDAAADDAADKRERLAALVDSFDATLADLREAAPVPAVTRDATARTELRLALDVLCERSKAAAAVVVDEQSPEVWGTSGSAAWLDSATRADEDGGLLERAAEAGFDFASWLAQSDPVTPVLPKELRDALLARRSALRLLVAQTAAPAARLATLRAVALARAHDKATIRGDDFGAIVRRFGGIYRLALAFDSDYSELHAEATVARALPAIERLVRDLPPPSSPPPRAPASSISTETDGDTRPRRGKGPR